MTFCLHQLQEKCIVQNMPLYTVFSDFSKAFDTVPRKGLWKVLGEYGCPANGKGTAQRNASTCGRRKLHLQGIGGHKRCQARLRVRSDTVLSKGGWRNTTLRHVGYPQQLGVDMNQCPLPQKGDISLCQQRKI